MEEEPNKPNKGLDNVGNILIILGLCLFTMGMIPILIGFGHIGIAAGSVAAGIQSAIGNVAGGSAFAHMTSLGMLGVFETLSISGLISTLGGLLLKFRWKIYFGWKKFQRSTVTWWESFSNDCRDWFQMVGRMFQRFGRNTQRFFEHLWWKITH